MGGGKDDDEDGDSQTPGGHGHKQLKGIAKIDAQASGGWLACCGPRQGAGDLGSDSDDSKKSSEGSEDEDPNA